MINVHEMKKSIGRLGISGSAGIYAVAFYMLGWYDEKNTPSGELLPGPMEAKFSPLSPEKILECYKAGSRDFTLKKADSEKRRNTYAQTSGSKFLTSADSDYD